MSIVIISDDLTGALDSAVCFVRRGLTGCVAVSVSAFKDALARNCDVVGVCTSSRDVPEDQARKQVSLALGCLASKPDVVLKKIDSRLKGNIAAELNVLCEHWQSSDVFVCPAIPAQGRVVRHGKLAGSGVDVPIEIAPLIGECECIPDVETVSDISNELPDDLSSKLLVGAAGLAEALAHRVSQKEVSGLIESLPQPAFLAIGSRDPITRAQVDAIRADCEIVAAPNGVVGEAVSVASDGNMIIEMVDGEDAVSGAVAGERFSATVGQYLEHRPPATLLASGGETAAAILVKSGIGILEVMGEVLPGMPLSKATFNGREIQIVTKSGGFGSEDALHHVLSLLDRK